MSDLTITTRADGTGTLATPHQTHNITAESLPVARQQLLDLAANEARQAGRELTLTAHDDGTTFHLVIDPQGTTRPAPSAPQSPVPPAPDTAATVLRPVPTQAPSTPEPAPADSSPTADPAPIAEPTPVPSPQNWEQDPHPAPAAPAEPAPAPSDGIDETDPAWQAIAARPAEDGSRGSFNRRFGTRLKPNADELAKRRTDLVHERAREAAARDAEAAAARAHHAAEEQRRTRRAERARENETRRRRQRELIQTNFQGTRTVLIANPKGGARKTTTTYLLAATMGIIRGGSTVAWDANETMGTLGERSHQDLHDRTVVDLLQQAASDFTSIQGSRLGTLDRYVRPQGDAHFDVLASDEDPTRQDIVDADGFNTVHEILSRFYRLIFIDTGNNIRVSHFLAAVEAADQLVIPVAAGRDSARAARKMMEALTAAGHGELVTNAVVLIHDLEAISDADPDYVEVARTVADEFTGRVAAVVPIPFDAALKGGDEIDYDALQTTTRQAYQDAAEAIATSLRRTIQAETA